MNETDRDAVVNEARKLVTLTRLLFTAKRLVGSASTYEEWLSSENTHGRLRGELAATELRLAQLFAKEESE